MDLIVDEMPQAFILKKAVVPATERWFLGSSGVFRIPGLGLQAFLGCGCRVVSRVGIDVRLTLLVNLGLFSTS